MQLEIGPKKKGRSEMHLTKCYLRESSIIKFAKKIVLTVRQVICGSSVANADAGLTKSVQCTPGNSGVLPTPSTPQPTPTPSLTPAHTHPHPPLSIWYIEIPCRNETGRYNHDHNPCWHVVYNNMLLVPAFRHWGSVMYICADELCNHRFRWLDAWTSPFPQMLICCQWGLEVS